MLTSIKPVWTSDNPKIKERLVDTSRYDFYDQALFIKGTSNSFGISNIHLVCDFSLQNLILKSYAKQAVKKLVCKIEKHRKKGHDFYSSNNWDTPNHDDLYLDRSILKIARTQPVLVRQV